MRDQVRAKQRKQQGAVIVGFAVELAVGTMVTIAFAFFLLDSAMHSLYREKLAYVSGQGALFAARYTGKDVQDATKNYVSALCGTMGLPASQLSVKTADTSVNGQASVSCAVSALFPLLQGSIFPSTINVSDTSLAMVNASPSSVVQSVNMLGIGNLVQTNMKGRVIGN